MQHLQTTVDLMAQLTRTVMPPMEQKLDSIYKVARGKGTKLPPLALYSKMPNLTHSRFNHLVLTDEEGDMLTYDKNNNPLLFVVRMIPDFEISDKIVEGLDQTKHYLTLQVALIEDSKTPVEDVLVKGFDQGKVVCGVYLTNSNLQLRGKLSPSNVDGIPIGLLASLFAKTHAVLDMLRAYVGCPDFDLVNLLSVGQPADTTIPNHPNVR